MTLSRNKYDHTYFLLKTFNGSLTQPTVTHNLLHLCPSPSTRPHAPWSSILWKCQVTFSSCPISPNIQLLCDCALHPSTASSLLNNKLHLKLTQMLQLCSEDISANFWPPLPIPSPQWINLFDILSHHQVNKYVSSFPHHVVSQVSFILSLLDWRCLREEQVCWCPALAANVVSKCWTELRTHHHHTPVAYFRSCYKGTGVIFIKTF